MPLRALGICCGNELVANETLELCHKIASKMLAILLMLQGNLIVGK